MKKGATHFGNIFTSGLDKSKCIAPLAYFVYSLLSTV